MPVFVTKWYSKMSNAGERRDPTEVTRAPACSHGLQLWTWEHRGGSGYT